MAITPEPQVAHPLAYAAAAISPKSVGKKRTTLGGERAGMDPPRGMGFQKREVPPFLTPGVTEHAG